MMKQKRILIIRPDRIGDVVLSTPLPREIKKTFPNSFVAVLVKKYTEDIYFNNPNVDKILLIDDFDDGLLKNFFRKVRQIRSYEFTHSLTLLPTERLNYLLFFSGIPYRVGVGHKFYQFITFTHYANRRKYIPLRHEADYCMDLARKLGIQTDNLDSEIFLTDQEKKEVYQVRYELLDSKRYLIGVHTTSGNSSPNWEAAEYKRLVKNLTANDEVSVVVTDNKIPHELEGLPNVSYPNIGKSLRDTFINFAALDLLISSSTGPMHIAAALKVKTLSTFCPLTACSPKLWGPKGNESKIVLPTENYCQTKCPGDPKKCTFSGEGGIDAKKILEELKLFLYLHLPTGR